MSDHAGSFAQAVAAATPSSTADRPPAPPPSPPAPVAAPTPTAPIDTSDELVDPRTGEIIDLATAATDQLVQVVLEARRRSELLTTWRKACETELRARLEREGRRVAVVGDYQLQIEAGNRRDWDPDDLQLVVTDLIDQGVVTLKEAAGLIKREVKVDGTVARQLLGRLTGDPKAQVEACFTWRKGASKLVISEVPDLADALPDAS